MAKKAGSVKRKPKTDKRNGAPDQPIAQNVNWTPDRANVALQVENWPIANLLRYANNSRDHSEDQLAQIAASIQEFGFINPCLVDAGGVLIAGHGRISSAQKLGMISVPVIKLGHLTETQARALRVADNAIPLNATWNFAALKLELEALELADFPVTLLGFSQIQIVQFMAGVPTGKDPEAAPEPPATPVSRKGDLWLLGDHRLLCGDATSAEDVERLLDGAKPHLMVTDQPYGVDYDPTWRNGNADGRGKVGGGAGKNIGSVPNDDRADWTPAWKLFPGHVAYVWHGGLTSPLVAETLLASGFELRSQIIWNKDRLIIGRGNFHWKHEPAWYAVRRGATANWSGDRTQSTVWDIGRGPNETGHSTQKPIECMKRPIENNSQPGDAVYEPFSGSFTTGIACEITGRRCYAMEVAPQYVDMGLLRWQELAGKEARLDAPGNPTYAEVQADRAKPVRKRKRERNAA